MLLINIQSLSRSLALSLSLSLLLRTDPWAEELAGAFGFAFWDHMRHYNFAQDSRQSSIVAIRTKYVV
jgi:hypothetical protein